MATTTTKKTRKPSGPKPVYVVYTIGGDADGNEDFTVHLCTRKAEKALQEMDDRPGSKYKRIMLA